MIPPSHAAKITEIVFVVISVALFVILVIHDIYSWWLKMYTKEKQFLNKHKKMCGITRIIKWKCPCNNKKVVEADAANSEYGFVSDCETHRNNRQCPKCKTVIRV